MSTTKRTAREEILAAAEEHGWKVSDCRQGVIQAVKGVLSSGGRIMTVRLAKNDSRVLSAQVNDDEISGIRAVLAELAR